MVSLELVHRVFPRVIFRGGGAKNFREGGGTHVEEQGGHAYIRNFDTFFAKFEQLLNFIN